jgi:Arc/MetJ-type ribon-helix-helix transcriptional regulator
MRIDERIRKAYNRCQIFYLRTEVSMTTTAMTVHLPPRLVEQMDTYVQAGWFSDLDTLIVEALRRYLETHQLELQEHFLRQDVDWGLQGRD